MNYFVEFTAVGAVIGVHPIIFAPRNGLSFIICFLKDIKPGISKQIQCIKLVNKYVSKNLFYKKMLNYIL